MPLERSTIDLCGGRPLGDIKLTVDGELSDAAFRAIAVLLVDAVENKPDFDKEGEKRKESER